MKKQLFTAFTVGLCMTANVMAQVPSYVPTNGLVGWWPFNGNANDESGNGNNGTVNGATLTTDRFGVANKAYSFTNNSISVPANISYTQTPISYSFWFNRMGTGNPCNGNETFQTIFSTGNWSQSREVNIQPDTRLGIQKSIASGCPNELGVISNIVNNTWYHGVVTYQSNLVKVYLNGVLIGTVAENCSVTTVNTTSYIGASNSTIWACVGYFKGKIDDFAIYNRLLTDQEITTLYQGCSLPTATITPQGATTFCSGGFVNLVASTGSGYTYQWYRNGSIISNATTSSYSATQSGNYTVVISANGCSATSNATTVTVNTTPSANITAAGNTTFCSGSFVTLNASTGSGYTYQWLQNGNPINNATSSSINATTAGNYSVTINANNCSATSLPTTITVNPTPTVTLTPSGSTTFCQGGFVILNATGATTYQWNTGATSANLTVNQSGTYTVIGTANGCSASVNQSVTVNPTPIVTLNGLNNFTNVSASPTTLIGNPSGGIYNGSGVTGNLFNPSIAGLGTKTVNYSFTSTDGCSGIATQSTIVYDTLGVVCTSFDTVTTYISVTDTLIINTTLGLPTPNNENTILIYPNPASDHITIDNGNFTAMAGYSIKITNNAGQQVFQSAINQAQFYVDLSTWSGDGLYFVYLIDPQNNTVTVRKIVLQ